MSIFGSKLYTFNNTIQKRNKERLLCHLNASSTANTISCYKTRPDPTCRLQINSVVYSLYRCMSHLLRIFKVLQKFFNRHALNELLPNFQSLLPLVILLDLGVILALKQLICDFLELSFIPTIGNTPADTLSYWNDGNREIITKLLKEKHELNSLKLQKIIISESVVTCIVHIRFSMCAGSTNTNSSGICKTLISTKNSIFLITYFTRMWLTL